MTQAKLYGGTADGKKREINEHDIEKGFIVLQKRELDTSGTSPQHTAGLEEKYKLERIGDPDQGDRVTVVGYLQDELVLRDTPPQEEFIENGAAAAEAKVKRMIQRRIDDAVEAAQATRVSEIRWNYTTKSGLTRVVGTSRALYPV